MYTYILNVYMYGYFVFVCSLAEKAKCSVKKWRKKSAFLQPASQQAQKRAKPSAVINVKLTQFCKQNYKLYRDCIASPGWRHRWLENIYLVGWLYRCMDEWMDGWWWFGWIIILNTICLHMARQGKAWHSYNTRLYWSFTIIFKYNINATTTTITTT